MRWIYLLKSCNALRILGANNIVERILSMWLVVKNC